MMEVWLERAIEDELGKVIDRYRSQGKDVHNVGRLKEKVAADINALRGTNEWTKLKLKYDPQPVNRLAWCRVCDKPVSMGSVSAWLEDRGGRIYCSQECKDAAPRVFLTLNEYKAKVRAAGSVTGRRKEYVDGELVDGEEFVLSWDEVKNFAGDYVPSEADAVSVVADDSDDEIEWSD
jgi:hypothetical protein